MKCVKLYREKIIIIPLVLVGRLIHLPLGSDIVLDMVDTLGKGGDFEPA